MLWNSTKAKVSIFYAVRNMNESRFLKVQLRYVLHQIEESIWHIIIAPRLSVQRLRTLQQKKEAQAKANRRDIATLVEKGKLETARIKVETSAYIYIIIIHISVDLPSVINEDIYVELLELLELYCELLLARFGLLDLKYVFKK
jgi:hypothetical protein